MIDVSSAQGAVVFALGCRTCQNPLPDAFYMECVRTTGKLLCGVGSFRFATKHSQTDATLLNVISAADRLWAAARLWACIPRVYMYVTQ